MIFSFFGGMRANFGERALNEARGTCDGLKKGVLYSIIEEFFQFSVLVLFGIYAFHMRFYFSFYAFMVGSKMWFSLEYSICSVWLTMAFMNYSHRSLSFKHTISHIIKLIFRIRSRGNGLQ